jgi:hypothetical protein
VRQSFVVGIGIRISLSDCIDSVGCICEEGNSLELSEAAVTAEAARVSLDSSGLVRVVGRLVFDLSLESGRIVCNA